MMTFSFKPRRKSTRPAIEASVSTLVVSWNEAAEMKLSVQSDAFVIPKSNGSAVADRATCLNDFLVFRFESQLVSRFARQEVGVADILDLHLAEHVANDHFDVLVVNLHTLETINFLHFIHHILGESLLAENAENVVWIDRSVHQRLTSFDIVAFVDCQVAAFTNEVFRARPLLG